MPLRLLLVALFIGSLAGEPANGAFAPDADFDQSGLVDPKDLMLMLTLGVEGDANHHLHGLLGVQARDVYDFARQWYTEIDPLKTSGEVLPSTSTTLISAPLPESIEDGRPEVDAEKGYSDAGGRNDSSAVEAENSDSKQNATTRTHPDTNPGKSEGVPTGAR